jgi:hypothetical protein
LPNFVFSRNTIVLPGFYGCFRSTSLFRLISTYVTFCLFGLFDWPIFSSTNGASYLINTRLFLHLSCAPHINALLKLLSNYCTILPEITDFLATFLILAANGRKKLQSNYSIGLENPRELTGKMFQNSGFIISHLKKFQHILRC